MALIDNLISYWKLDESTGTTANDSHGSNDGTSSSGVIENASGKINTSYDYTSSSYITTVGTPISLDTANVTVSFWFNADSKTTYQIPLGKYDNNSSGMGWTTKLRNNATVWFMIGNNGGGGNDYATSTATFDTGTWHHYVGSYDGSDIKVYLDGVLVGETSSTKVLNTTSVSLQFNGDASTITESFNGKLDEIAIWSRALTDGGVSVDSTAGGEIAELYNSGNGLAYPFSGTNFQLNLTDSISLIDNIVSVKTILVSLADNQTFTEALIKANEIGISENFTIDELLSYNGSLTIALGDTLGLTDTLDRKSIFNIILAETLLMADNANASQGFNEAISDSQTISDTLSKSSEFKRILTDIQTIADSPEFERQVNIFLSDDFDFSDSLSYSLVPWIGTVLTRLIELRNINQALILKGSNNFNLQRKIDNFILKGINNNMILKNKNQTLILKEVI